MKLSMLAVAVAAASLGAAAVGQDSTPEAPAPQTAVEKQSYALGATLGGQLRKNSVDIEVEPFIQGLRDSLAGKTAMTEREVGLAVGDIKKDRESKKAAAREELRTKNEMEGQVYLAANKTKEGVVALDSGLQYRVLKAGGGAIPTADDTVICHYKGSLIDGKEFDSSYKRRAPATFSVRKVIKGWSEALQLMPVGSKWQLVVPPYLAYGDQGAGSRIPPSATLIFEVELIGIQNPHGNPAGPGAAPAASADVSSGVDESQPAKAPESPAPAAGAAPPVSRPSVRSGLTLSFKLDPRLSGGSYGGEKWVSPPTYLGAAAQDTVEIKARGTDERGRPVRVRPTWVASDPSMVTLSPSQGEEVRLTVLRAGQSTVEVTSAGLSKRLAVRADYRDKAIQVAIVQE